jgi:hypothetical protein
MAYLTFRVEVTRDETRAAVPPRIEITAYLDRIPETDVPERGRLSRAYTDVWKSRLRYAGDFESLAEALAAIEAAYPEADAIRCYEYTVDDEYPVEKVMLGRIDGRWVPRQPRS